MNRFSTLSPAVFRYFSASARASVWLRSARVGPLAFGNRVQKHRFTDATRRTSWRSP